MTVRYSAELAWRWPPRLSRYLDVLPLLAGTGQTPHSLAQAGSERTRSTLSPATMSISAAVSGPIPNAATIAGATASVSVVRCRSCSLISTWSCCQRRASPRSACLAAASGAVLGAEGGPLAIQPGLAPVGPVDLDHAMALSTQVAGDPGAIRCRALDPEGEDLPMRHRPALELIGAASLRCPGQRADPTAEFVKGDCDVDVLVGVDADRDLPRDGLLRDAAHGCRSFPWLAARGPGGRTGL